MNNKDSIPEFLTVAFPALLSSVFVRQLASPVPLSPDTTFDIYITASKQFVTLVTTDYADPINQSHELQKISGQHRFQFSSLIKPYSNKNDHIQLSKNDNAHSDYLIKNSSKYYYLANIHSAT